MRSLSISLWAILLVSFLVCVHSQVADKAHHKPGTQRELEIASTGKPVVPPPKRCRFFRTLLSLDGGGMRGIVTTQVLRTLAYAIKDHLLDNQELLTEVNSSFRFVTKDDFHVDIADYFDAIAGISAGSWMATYIASKGGANKESEEIFKMEHIKRRFGEIRAGSVEGLEVFFMEYGVYIYPPQALPFMFKPRFWGAPVPLVDLGTVPKYQPTGLEWTLKKFLGDTMLSDVKTSLLIAAFDLNIRSAVQFVYDKIDGIESRFIQRSIEVKTNALQKCIQDLEKFTDTTEDMQLKFQQITDRCKKDESIETERSEVNSTKYSEITKKVMGKPTVRTGYVWTRTIPRDLNGDEDYEEPGIKYFNGMDYFLRDLTRASSAFPMLHGAKNIKPFFDIRHEYDLIDGAMVGNNPTLQALVWMSSKPNINLTDIAVLSIGTGTAIQDLMNLGTGGFIQWTGPIVNLILDSSSEFVQSNIDYLYYQTMEYLIQPNQYLRIQVAREQETVEGHAISVGANDVTLLRELKAIGEKNALRYKANIEHFVRTFIFGGCSEPKFKDLDQLRIDARAENYDRVKATYDEEVHRVEDLIKQTAPSPAAAPLPPPS